MQEDDYGSYKCVAKNPRGETDGGIRLYCKFHFFQLFFIYIFFSLNLLCFHMKIISIVNSFIALYLVEYQRINEVINFENKT